MRNLPRGSPICYQEELSTLDPCFLRMGSGDAHSGLPRHGSKNRAPEICGQANMVPADQGADLTLERSHVDG